MSQCYKHAFGGLVKTVGWTKHNFITLDALGNVQLFWPIL